MKKNYAQTSHRFQQFLFLPTTSITYLKIRKKYGKVSHSFSKKYVYYEILQSNYLSQKFMLTTVSKYFLINYILKYFFFIFINEQP